MQFFVNLFLFQPLSWQHPYVPVLSRGMLDFLMAPTAFLMGCHLSHYEEVASVSTDLQMTIFNAKITSVVDIYC